MKSARGSSLWKKVGNVRRRATDGEVHIWDSRPETMGGRGTYVKEKHGRIGRR